jgi:hypothetical protein
LGRCLGGHDLSGLTAFGNPTYDGVGSALGDCFGGTPIGTPSSGWIHFQINSELAAGLENVLIAGRLTTAQGFVDIASTTPLELPFPGAGLQNGSLLMTGAGEIATVHYNGSLAPDVTIAPKP